MKTVTVFELKSLAGKLSENKKNLPAISRFQNLLERADNVLFRTSSVFPFDFFPDELAIDTDKVSIIIHGFYLSNDIHSISIDMIKDIEVETGPFLASLVIVPDGYPGHSIVVKNLKKKDAIKARMVIQGLMLLKRKGIDASNLSIPDLKDVEYLGKTHLSVW